MILYRFSKRNHNTEMYTVHEYTCYWKIMKVMFYLILLYLLITDKLQVLLFDVKFMLNLLL